MLCWRTLYCYFVYTEKIYSVEQKTLRQARSNPWILLLHFRLYSYRFQLCTFWKVPCVFTAIFSCSMAHTVPYSYNNAANFLKYSHNRHPIARPWGRGLVCLLWVWNLIYVLLLSLKYRMQYRDKLDHSIMALDCIKIEWNTGFGYPQCHV